MKNPSIDLPTQLVGETKFPVSVGTMVLVGIALLVLLFLIVPILIIVAMSFGDASYIQFPPRVLSLKWYMQYFGDVDWMSATWFSLKIACATTISSTVIGSMASIALVRGAFPGKAAIQAIALSPLIVPHIVIAIALYLFFAPLGLVGNFGGFLIADTVLSVPYVVITVSAALKSFDPMLERAALNCGATRVTTFFSVVLPDIVPGMAAGAVFAFLASFDEATVAFFLSDTGGKTITRKFFEDIDYNLTPVIAAVATVTILLSLALMAAIRVLERRASGKSEKN
ncbi:ABC transporter permease [Paraburkholderia sp. BL21I4N1]|uniref:ABC transporter permease n=1 Tax=Paraburkholderia sp. BL21I4N1 TaxID=1938801 RepID=UPI000D491804|nr:ABC transporter permease [Paraburkholderia sp. BL21I4N1]PQV42984.1 mannopine transport system permease protein [Paraburkholderia sp. BL21I4N1]